jgi:glc operon protein GlcG
MKHTTCLAIILSTGLAVFATAQTPAPSAPAQPPALSYAMAQQAMDAAEAEARRNKWNVTIVVTDAAGVPVMVRRLDGASARSFDVASRKAATVVASKLATSAYGAQVKEGKVKEVPNGITFAGGVPIMRGGELIGAIGTSGVQAGQDEQVSQAGANAIR